MAELDYYKILGVPSNSSAIQIKKRYQQLAKQHHPDHQGDESSMIIINSAYEVLSNPSKRIEYDHQRRLIRKSRAAAVSTPKNAKTNWSKTNHKADATNKDLIIITVFVVLILIAMLGFR